jgi:hypothetical protein
MRALSASRTSLVPGGVLAGPWVRDPLWRRARAVPSLDLRFADNKSLTDAVTGASLVTFTRASNGTYTDSAGVIQTAATDVPRFDHNPTTGESLGLLVEEQRANLLLRSEEFGTTWTAPGLSAVTPNTTVAPNGVTTADTLVETTGVSEVHRVSQTISVVSGTTYTLSVFAKQGSRQYIYLGFGPNATWNSTGAIGFFDLQNGTIGTLVNCTATIVAYPNGWYRCTVTSTPTATNAGAIANIGISSNGTTQTYTGDGSNAVILWGAQLEAGAFPTSYIPTVASTVTRAVDVADMTGTNFSSWYRQDEGSLFGQYVLRGGNQGRFRIWDGNGAGFNSWDIGPSATAGGVLGFTTRSNQGTNSGPRSRGRIDGATNLGYVVKHAAAIAANDFACYTRSQSGDFNNNTGSAVPASGEYLPPLVDRLTLANNLSASITISRLSYYPVRLPDAQLQALTQ